MKELEHMQVVVLMGGLGSRLKNYGSNCPKSMTEVENKPFFDYQLEILMQAGFRKFLFLVGYGAKNIEDYYRDGSQYGVTISYVYDGEELRGTGGAICNAYEQLENIFILLYGDSFMDIPYEETIYRFEEGKKEGKNVLMTVLKNCNRFDQSNVWVKDGQIVLYDKRDIMEEMEYIDYGIGIYTKQVFEQYRDRKFLDLSEIQKQASIDQIVSVHIVNKRFYEIGTPESLEEFKKYVKSRFYEEHPAVFLDRDGVINEIIFSEETEQLDSPLKEDEFSLFPQVPKVLKKLKEEGFYLFIVTNQPAAAKGKIKLKNLYDVNCKCMEELKERGVEIDGIEMCPHYPKKLLGTKEEFLIKQCDCRKPGSGLLQKISKKYKLDKKRTYMVGDSYTDILAGNKFGVKTILLGELKCDFCKRLEEKRPDFICRTIEDVCHVILEDMH